VAIWQAWLQGFSLTARLWLAGVLLLPIYAGGGALATLFLPYEVVQGQVRVPPPTDVKQALHHFAIGLALYLLIMGLVLFVLAGVFFSLRQLLNGQTVSVRQYLQSCRRGYIPILRWGIGFLFLEFSIAIGVGLGVMFLLYLLGQGGMASALAQAGFGLAFFLVGFALSFSPIVLVEENRGVGSSFRRSARLVSEHPLGLLVLLIVVAFVVATAYALWLPVAQWVRLIRAGLGVAPFAPGWPVFLFGLVLDVPQAFATVYLPSVLYTYYAKIVVRS